MSTRTQPSSTSCFHLLLSPPPSIERLETPNTFSLTPPASLVSLSLSSPYSPRPARAPPATAAARVAISIPSPPTMSI